MYWSYIKPGCPYCYFVSEKIDLSPLKKDKDCIEHTCEHCGEKYDIEIRIDTMYQAWEKERGHFNQKKYKKRMD